MFYLRVQNGVFTYKTWRFGKIRFLEGEGPDRGRIMQQMDEGAWYKVTLWPRELRVSRA